MDEALVDAWLSFPGLKVGKIYLYSSLQLTGLVFLSPYLFTQ
jgi:hypothetical protein